MSLSRRISASRARVTASFASDSPFAAAQRTLAALDPQRTAVLLISKSFGTQETLLNGAILRQWLGDDSRLYAITTNAARAESVDRIIYMSQNGADSSSPYPFLRSKGVGEDLVAKSGTRWRANFYRFNRDRDAQTEQLSWSPTIWPGFHQPARFGHLRFAGK